MSVYSRFSPNFVERCLKGEFQPGDIMPCPRCGEGDVRFTEPRKRLVWAAPFVLGAAVLFALRVTVAAQIVAIPGAVIIAASYAGEPSYRCGSCGHAWRFRDAQKWRVAIIHDLEAKARRASKG